MNIEKKKVERRTKLSSIAKKAIATSLGIAASATFIACGMDMADQPIPDTEPSSPSTESSDSNDISSSSKYLDIPQSHEAISSEILEALSSAAEPANSPATDAAFSVAQPASSSANALSSAEQPASTSATPVSSATVPPNLSSSSFKFGDTLPGYQECPPPFPSTDPCKCVPDGTTVKYQTEFGVQVIMCPQSSSSYNSDGFSFSMVTTFERDDIIA
ncbi:MAG: hypothetical protein J6W51_05610 [Fibrobacter sp.]|nr:hypothetical protein [Fibrobacter sp.]